MMIFGPQRIVCLTEETTECLYLLGQEHRIVDRAPDIIIGSLCGKKFRSEKVATRNGWQEVPAVRNNQIFEIKSANILQPGPAALTDGVAQLHQIVKQWEASYA